MCFSSERSQQFIQNHIQNVDHFKESIKNNCEEQNRYTEFITTPENSRNCEQIMVLILYSSRASASIYFFRLISVLPVNDNISNKRGRKKRKAKSHLTNFQISPQGKAKLKLMPVDERHFPASELPIESSEPARLWPVFKLRTMS